MIVGKSRAPQARHQSRCNFHFSHCKLQVFRLAACLISNWSTSLMINLNYKTTKTSSTNCGALESGPHFPTISTLNRWKTELSWRTQEGEEEGARVAGHRHGLASASSLRGCFHGEIGPFRQTEEIGEKRRARAGGPHTRRRTPDPRRLAIRACFTMEGGSSVGLFVLRHDSYAIL